MEEKKEKKISIILFIIIIVLVAVVSSITTIIIYGQILDKKAEEFLVKSIKEDMENLQEENEIVNNYIEGELET